MSFDEINRVIKSKGGDWVSLKKKGDTVEGKVLAAEVRDKSFKGKVIVVTSGPNEGKPRKEWLFTLETPQGVKKYAANENAQYAISGALNGRSLREGGYLKVGVVEDKADDYEQPTYKAYYTDPALEDPFSDDDEEAPF